MRRFALAGVRTRVFAQAPNLVPKKFTVSNNTLVVSSKPRFIHSSPQLLQKLRTRARRNSQNDQVPPPLHQAILNGDLELVKQRISKDSLATVDWNGRVPSFVAIETGNVEALKLLIAAGADVNAHNRPGLALIHQAVVFGELECLEALIEAGANVNEVDRYLSPPTTTAIYRGRLDCLRRLLEAGADPLWADRKQGRTLTHHAVIMGNVEILREVLSHGSPLHQPNSHGFSPISIATLKDHVACLEELIEKGADIQVLDSFGGNLVHTAAKSGCIGSLQVLLQHGLNPNQQTMTRARPIFWASQNGDADVMRILLKAGAMVNVVDRKGHTACLQILLESGQINHIDQKDMGGFTALEAAQFGGHAAGMRLLLKHGADPLVRDRWGKTVLHRAAALGTPECTQLLVDHGVSVAERDNYDNSPAQLVAHSGNAECLRVLLKAGSNVNELGKSKRTLAHMAASHGCVEVLRVLAECGADLNAMDQNFLTPAFHAVMKDHTDCLIFLLEHVNVNAVNQLGRSLAHQAALMGKLPMLELLKEHGCSLDLADEQGHTPAFFATIEENTDCLQFLLESGAAARTNINDFDRTLVHQAASYGKWASLQCLIENGADLNLTDKFGSTPATTALNKGHIDCFEALVEAGTDPNLPDGTGRTLVHHAARNSYAGALQFVINHGGDVTAKDLEGFTPLHSVADQGSIQQNVSILLQAGAEVDAQAHDGQTPLHSAILSGSFALLMESTPAQPETGSNIARHLLRAGASLDICDSQGRNAMDIASGPLL